NLTINGGPGGLVFDASTFSINPANPPYSYPYISFADQIQGDLYSEIIFSYPNVMGDILEGDEKGFFNLSFSVDIYEDTVIPIPSTLILLGSGLLGLAGWSRFRKG
ncbi:MAG: hypothetical protein WBQ36_12905, partial [Desulfobaccales bacterium]